MLLDDCFFAIVAAILQSGMMLFDQGFLAWDCGIEGPFPAVLHETYVQGHGQVLYLWG